MYRLTIVLTIPALAAWAQSPQPADPKPREQLVSFDCDRAEVVWAEQRWRLQAGGMVLKDFGRREAEAREALRQVRSLRLNQYGAIGSPAPVLEYWLCDGHAPQGPVHGLRELALDPDCLRVEYTGGQWSLGEGQRTLFKFGHRGDDAELALAVIRKHRFTRLAVVGQGAPSMLIFLSGADGTPAHAPHRSAIREEHKRDAIDPALQAKFGPGAAALRNPEVPALRSALPARPGPRTPFAGGQLTQLPSGRQLGAVPPQPDVTRLADRVAFDYRQVQTRRDESGGGWVLAAGSHVLARFGDREYEARQALALLRELHLTEQVAVGQPVRFSYFLVNGRPPRGVPLGVEARAFQPDALVVRPAGAQWAICDDAKPILVLGASADEAVKFLEVMRKERIDRVCTLGASRGEGFTLLMRSR